MAVICKLFIQSRSQSPNGDFTYELGAVCRGEENKDWSAATPTGKLVHLATPVLDEVWDDKVSGRSAEAEVFVTQIEDPEGDWAFEKCEFTYGGCSIALRQKGRPWGKLELGINAKPATQQLRQAFARSLESGEAAKYRIVIERAH